MRRRDASSPEQQGDLESVWYNGVAALKLMKCEALHLTEGQASSECGVDSTGSPPTVEQDWRALIPTTGTSAAPTDTWRPGTGAPVEQPGGAGEPGPPGRTARNPADYDPALQTDEAVLRLVFAMACRHMAMVHVDLDGTIRCWGRGDELLFGYSAEEMMGRSILALVPPDRTREAFAVLEKLRHGEDVDLHESVRVHKDGHLVSVAIAAWPIKDTGGSPVGAIAILRDITERKRTESELRASRDQIQAILQGVDDGVVAHEPGGRAIYANATAARLLGFDSVADLLAAPPGEVARRYDFHDEQGQTLSHDSRPGDVAAQGMEARPAVIRYHLLADGSEGWAILRTVPVNDEHGRLQFTVCIFSDITERRAAEEALRESEARFQAFMDHSPTVAFMKDEQGKLAFVNRAFERLFGLTAEQALGKDNPESQSEVGAGMLSEAGMDVLVTGRTRQISETIPTPDGRQGYWLTYEFPITLPSGRRYLGGTSMEITERVRAEEALQDHTRRLRALSRQLVNTQESERRRIARDLHDQIGQALTAIKIDLQMAQRQAGASQGAASAPSRDIVARLDKSIALVERTIGQVREVSLDLRPSILDDLGLVSALLWYAEERAQSAGLGVAVGVDQIDAHLPPELEITCFRIAQEAISNAVRHARASQIRLELRRAGDQLILTVADDGVGFDIDSLPGLPGEEGAQDAAGDLDGRRIDWGRGLGLKGMNERMLIIGGTLAITSSPGEGTIIRACFPLSAFAPMTGTRK